MKTPEEPPSEASKPADAAPAAKIAGQTIEGEVRKETSAKS